MTVHHQLVCSADEDDVILSVESLDEVSAEGEFCAARAGLKTLHVLVGVAPEEVAVGAPGGRLAASVDRGNVIACVNLEGQSAMDAEDLAVDDSGERERVEEVGAQFPDTGAAIFPDALVVEAARLRRLPCSSVRRQGKRTKKASRYRKDSHGITPVDIIAQENGVVVGTIAANSEEFLKVEELPVDVPADGDRAHYMLDIPFVQEKLHRLLEQRNKVALVWNLTVAV
jgi:hypothetical protein